MNTKNILKKSFIAITLISTLGLLGCNKEEQKTLLDTRNLIQGKVIKVADGDTVTLQTDKGEKLRIRMFGIDAPETKQEFGEQSKKYLTDLILNQNVSIREIHKDQYQRTVAIVFYKNEDINLKQLENGNAWYYRAFKKYQDSKDATAYDNAERSAQSSKKGLWKSSSAQAPWEFRKQKRLQDALE